MDPPDVQGRTAILKVHAKEWWQRQGIPFMVWDDRNPAEDHLFFIIDIYIYMYIINGNLMGYYSIYVLLISIIYVI